MINIVRSILEFIGGACITTAALIAIRIFWEKCVSPLFCDHKYKISGFVSIGDETLVYIKCIKCEKEKEILFDRKELEKWVK